jgi:1-acyl-sn-glycerol-3-phosphate acyltransferase
MIYPKKNKFIHWFVDQYIRRIVSRNFFEIRFDTVSTDKNKSVLLIANHFSIWDGLILYWLNHRLFGKNFHVMILEETSKKEKFLKYTGAFSINKSSKDIIRSLDYSAQLLTEPDNLVLIFPQGKLYSNFVDEVIFEKGIIKVLEQAADNCQVIFAAAFIENFAHKKPLANVYLATTDNNFSNIDQLQRAYRQHYNKARLQQTQIVI